jgi:hypothetical protein
MMNQKPTEDEREEAPQELPQVEPASGQDRVHAVVVFPFEMIPIHPVVRFQVADDRLDRRPSLQPPSDRLVLPRRHVNGFLRQRVLRPFVSPVAEHVRHRPSRQALRLADRTFQRVPVERIPVQRVDADHPVSPRRRYNGNFTTELVFLVCLPLRDAFHFRSVHRVHLVAVVPLLPEDLLCRGKKVRQSSLRLRTFSADVPHHAAQVRSKPLRLPLRTLWLAGMTVPALLEQRLLSHPLVALAKFDPLATSRRHQRPAHLVVQQSWSPFFGQSDKVKIRLTEGGGNEKTEPEAVLCGV